MPRTSDPTVRYLPPFSNPHETRRRRVSNIAICPPTYLPYSTYLGILHTSYSPIFSPSHLPHPSTNPIQPSHPFPPIPFLSTIQSKTMLPRPATKLHLTIDDITDYERRKAQRDALQQAQQQQQQQQEKSNANFLEEEKEESTRARAKAKSTREHQQRIMGSRT